MRIFQVKTFARFARSENLSDDRLAEAVERAERGLVDADLGGGIIKQRVARPGQGRSGGYRTLIAFRSQHIAVFLYGFAKNERQNIGPDELTTLQSIGGSWLVDPAKVTRDIAAGVLIEVSDDRKI